MKFLKTKKEHKQHFRMLLKVRDILNKNHVTPILTGSALLGAKRGRGMLFHCPGAVLSTYYSEIKPRENKIIKQLQKAGFKIQKRFVNRNYKIRVGYGRMNIEILGYSFNGKIYYRKLSNKIKVIPKIFFTKPLSKIKLGTHVFLAPRNIVGFLSFVYKNWKVVQSGAPTSYKNKRHMIT